MCGGRDKVARFRGKHVGLTIAAQVCVSELYNEEFADRISGHQPSQIARFKTGAVNKLLYSVFGTKGDLQSNRGRHK
jgi:hypothetical protein